jgi:hypothetical protein
VNTERVANTESAENATPERNLVDIYVLLR